MTYFCISSHTKVTKYYLVLQTAYSSHRVHSHALPDPPLCANDVPGFCPCQPSETTGKSSTLSWVQRQPKSVTPFRIVQRLIYNFILFPTLSYSSFAFLLFRLFQSPLNRSSSPIDLCELRSTQHSIQEKLPTKAHTQGFVLSTSIEAP